MTPPRPRTTTSGSRGQYLDRVLWKAVADARLFPRPVPSGPGGLLGPDYVSPGHQVVHRRTAEIPELLRPRARVGLEKLLDVLHRQSFYFLCAVFLGDYEHPLRARQSLLPAMFLLD